MQKRINVTMREEVHAWAVRVLCKNGKIPFSTKVDELIREKMPKSIRVKMPDNNPVGRPPKLRS